MHVFGATETMIAGMQVNFPANTNMLVYAFEGTPPTDFDDIGFSANAANLIQNCKNAFLTTLSYPSVSEVQLTQRSSLLKGADIVAKYAGETVNVYQGGSVVSTNFANHLVYGPSNFKAYGDYRDHKLFELFMYKQSSEANFAGLTTSYVTVSTNTNETFEFEYNRPIDVNCFGIKQGTAANTFMRQMVIEYYNGSAWVELVTSVLNVTGYQIIRFPEVTATRFRIRKLASGTAGTVLMAFAYFGKFDYEAGDVQYNLAVPTWAVIVPDFTSATVLTNLKAKLIDSYGNSPFDTDDFCFLVSASGIGGNGRLRFNAPVQANNDSKFDLYLAYGQLF